MVSYEEKSSMHGNITKKEIILDIRDLRIHYETPKGDVVAVNGINFHVCKGEIVGLVGESGCGKTTAAMGVLQLVQPPGRIIEGEVLINGSNLLKINERQLRKRRWREFALIPQGAMSSLNPVMKVYKQIEDVIITHDGRQSRENLKQRIMETFSLVGLPSRVYNLYPHELSGGMKQRVCIAMAIVLHPALIIADEPTSALDVVVQRMVAQTLLEVKSRLGMSIIMIGHDMGLQAQTVDRMIIMYAGNIVEIAPVNEAFDMPLHPYTRLLIESIPSIRVRKPLKANEVLLHDLRNPPSGCCFQLRCKEVMDICRKVAPPMLEIHQEHLVACHLCSLEKQER